MFATTSQGNPAEMPQPMPLPRLGFTIQHGINLGTLEDTQSIMEDTNLKMQEMSQKMALLTKTIFIQNADILRLQLAQQLREQIILRESALQRQNQAKLEEMLSSLTQKVAKTKGDNMRLRASNADALKEVAELKTQKAADTSTIQRLDDEKRTLNQKLASAQEAFDRETAGFVGEKAALNQKILKLESQKATLEQTLRQQDIALISERKMVFIQQSRIEGLEKHNAKIQSELQTAHEYSKKEHEQYNASFQEMKIRANELENRNIEVLNDHDVVLATSLNFVFEIASKDQSIAALEAKLQAAEQASQEMNKLCKAKDEAYMLMMDKHNRVNIHYEKTIDNAKQSLNGLKNHIHGYVAKYTTGRFALTIPTGRLLQAIYALPIAKFTEMANSCNAIVISTEETIKIAKQQLQALQANALNSANQISGQNDRRIWNTPPDFLAIANWCNAIVALL
jgi:hypothetical protein